MEDKSLEKFVWKEPRGNDSTQAEIKLVDCDEKKLQSCYNHCQEMLYNTGNKTPGRYVLIKTIQDQIERCRATLLVRWLRAEKGYSQQHCFEDIKTLINNNKEVLPADKLYDIPINMIIAEIPSEYSRVSIGLVLDACLSTLGIMDTSHITLNFLSKLGIYVTDKEKPELTEKDPKTGKIRDRIEVIKERENIDKSIIIKSLTTGLTYTEFHQMCRMQSKKYEEYTTAQLKTLSNKVWYRLQIRCSKQAALWEKLKKEIIAVADYKGIQLCLEPELQN